MIRFITDEHLPTALARALAAAGVDVVRIQAVGLRTASDPALLDWAAANGRVALSQDRSTLPDFANQRVAAGQPMPGVIVLRRGMSVGAAVAELLIVVGCGGPDDLRDQVLYLPM